MGQHDATRCFDDAMNAVYGNFDILTQEQVEHWTPPSEPGAGGHRGRYLWTDAFGVINLITLYQETTNSKYLILARRLVQTVHDVLGKTRDGGSRLPGATDQEPLKGGLRIGKMAAEGSDGDGQYHHYLTLWMFALNRLAIATQDPGVNDLALQLAKAIHPKFVTRRQPHGDLRMVWKISTDMEKVLVQSEGHLDAATGYAIYRLLQDTAAKQTGREKLLHDEIDEYFQIMNRKGALTPSDDMLDLGMGLWICHFFPEEEWSSKFSSGAIEIAYEVLSENSVQMRNKASRRLAFREFGACLGISCFGGDHFLKTRVTALIKFWEDHMEADPNEDLRPISQVMYAAALIPGAFRRGFITTMI